MRADQKGLPVIFCAWRGGRVKKEGVSWTEEGEQGGGLLDLDLDLFLEWWWLNKMGAEPSGCGRCARFLTDREQRKVNKRIQHRWRFQSIGFSLSLKGLGCGHPLCARLPCFAYHACGRCCQGEFNLIVFFLLLPKCLIPLCEIDSLGEHTQRRVWKPNLSKCCHCCRPSR